MNNVRKSDLCPFISEAGFQKDLNELCRHVVSHEERIVRLEGQAEKLDDRVSHISSEQVRFGACFDEYRTALDKRLESIEDGIRSVMSVIDVKMTGIEKTLQNKLEEISPLVMKPAMGNILVILQVLVAIGVIYTTARTFWK